MIKLRDIFPKRKTLQEIAEKIMQQKVIDLRAGKLIKRSYSKYTSKHRRRYGLQTSYVDLTGNNLYSRKSNRMFDSWKVEIKDHKIYIRFIYKKDDIIYSDQIRRYGYFLRSSNG